MDAISEMLKTAPQKPYVSGNALVDCIRACSICAQACTACADACLGQKEIDVLKRCVRLNLDCADLCAATERALTRQEQPDIALLRKQVELMAMVCRTCGDECERHKDMHPHCKVCMEACRACEQACNSLLGSSEFAQAGVH